MLCYWTADFTNYVTYYIVPLLSFIVFLRNYSGQLNAGRNSAATDYTIVI